MLISNKEIIIKLQIKILKTKIQQQKPTKTKQPTNIWNNPTQTTNNLYVKPKWSNKEISGQFNLVKEYHIADLSGLWSSEART